MLNDKNKELVKEMLNNQFENNKDYVLRGGEDCDDDGSESGTTGFVKLCKQYDEIWDELKLGERSETFLDLAAEEIGDFENYEDDED